uniref:filamin/ABP280 repeat domain-containing protein n=1 Tax=Salmonella sp. s54836 TaxID=3159673 RepID=UPI00398015A0
MEIGVSGSCTPCDFITVKHNGDYTFNVSYDIPEAGETTIVVKWHGVHIPGSPFVIQTDESD